MNSFNFSTSVKILSHFVTLSNSNSNNPTSTKVATDNEMKIHLPVPKQ